MVGILGEIGGDAYAYAMRGFLSDLWIFLPRCVCFSITSFLLLKERPPAFVLNPILMRRTSPCVVLISSGQQQQFYRTTSNLYPTIPRSATQGAFAPHRKAPHFSISPPPHQREIFNLLGGYINSHIHFFSFGKSVADKRGKWRTRCETHIEQNQRQSGSFDFWKWTI
jgi:hypothetical protein